MILADSAGERQAALRKLLPLQRADFDALFRAMDGLPVTVRLLDPPLHEFLPDLVELTGEIAEAKLALRRADTLAEMDRLLEASDTSRALLRQVERLHERNPMLGFRGCRLAIAYPEVAQAQVRFTSVQFRCHCFGHPRMLASTAHGCICAMCIGCKYAQCFLHVASGARHVTES